MLTFEQIENRMEDERIIELVRKSLNSLFKDDWFLLYCDVSERSVVHKFAEHLQRRFVQYDYVVDCEYNNDNAWGHKIDSGLMRKHFNESLFIPDIIIHRRTLEGVQTNEHNICIIEMKLSTCVKDEERLKDDENLTFATFNEDGTLIYQLGIYIELWAGINARSGNNTIRKDVKAFTVYKGGRHILLKNNLNLNVPIRLN